VRRPLTYIAIGVILGGAAGFLAGLLLAPSSGQKTRERLANEALRAADLARTLAEQAEGAAEMLGGRVETLPRARRRECVAQGA
jgi:gas vesicle protein